MPEKIIGEAFGFPADSSSPEAVRHRRDRLCPFGNGSPNCTKDSVSDPLGVCSIWHDDRLAVTCPVRFRQDRIALSQAAEFFFAEGTPWVALGEVRLLDAHSRSSGNVDYVIVSYDDYGRVLDFGSVEVQAVYISGNMRNPFRLYMDECHEDPGLISTIDWGGELDNLPRPDYLSSSRKRLAPQLLFKGGILNEWRKKQAVVIHSGFWDTLPELPTVPQNEADLAWLVYDLEERGDRFSLVPSRQVFTKFTEAMPRVTTAQAGNMENFIELLQTKLDDTLKEVGDRE